MHRDRNSLNVWFVVKEESSRHHMASSILDGKTILWSLVQCWSSNSRGIGFGLCRGHLVNLNGNFMVTQHQLQCVSIITMMHCLDVCFLTSNSVTFRHYTVSCLVDV